ncbi:MAG: DUF3098 domain-containing protein [Cyclobacteriaceae bacterium]|mgnify:CR=1 FL=1|tara:strand:+ start:493 stop:717 length:225 start_codon:yes stop_codon:yes gene_type:complete
MSDKNKFAFGKKNYMIMIGGVLVILIGFVIMASDSEPYGFGFLGLTLGPIVVMLGFLIQFVAIFFNDKKDPANK